MENLSEETLGRLCELLNSASLSFPDLYVSLRGVFSSTNPHLQHHSNDTNCQCNYVLICTMCGWCVAYIIIRTNQPMWGRVCARSVRANVLVVVLLSAAAVQVYLHVDELSVHGYMRTGAALLLLTVLKY